MFNSQARSASPLLLGLGLGLAGSIMPATAVASSGSWNYKASLPTPLQNIGTAAVGGKLYVFGGWSSTPAYDAIHSSVYAYDPAADSWATRASMPTARHWSTCSVVNGVVYVIGGETRGIANPGWTAPTAVVEAYDPSTDTWATKASMPTPRWGATSQAVNGKIYVIGGSNAYSYYTAVEEYDPTTDSWTTKAPMPTGRTVHASGLVNGVIYVAGGATNVVFATLEAYDPAADSWTTKSPMATARQTLGMAAFEGELYALGGFSASEASFNSVEIYSPSTDSWRAGAAFQQARGTVGAEVVGGMVYVVGGSTPPNSTVGTVEAFALDTTPPTITAPADVTVAWNGSAGQSVSLGAPSVADSQDPSLIVTNDAPALFSLGTTTVTWTATDHAGNSATATQQVTVVNALTALGPAQVWVGLKNSDDVGTNFDLLAEVLRNGSVVGTGQLDGVSGGSSGFNNAVLRTITEGFSTSVSLASGDVLGFRLSVRIGTTGHRSGTARLWLGDSAADSRFGATIGGSADSYFLVGSSTLSKNAAGTGSKTTVDVKVDRAVGGNPFKAFGTWTYTIP